MNESEKKAMSELATRWVDMAQNQADIANTYQSARADGAAGALRLCAEMLGELIEKAAGQ